MLASGVGRAIVAKNTLNEFRQYQVVKKIRFVYNSHFTKLDTFLLGTKQ